MLIAAELYYKDISYTDYLKELTSSVKDDMTKNYLPLFVKKNRNKLETDSRLEGKMQFKLESP